MVRDGLRPCRKRKRGAKRVRGCPTSNCGCVRILYRKFINRKRRAKRRPPLLPQASVSSEQVALRLHNTIQYCVKRLVGAPRRPGVTGVCAMRCAQQYTGRSQSVPPTAAAFRIVSAPKHAGSCTQGKCAVQAGTRTCDSVRSMLPGVAMRAAGPNLPPGVTAVELEFLYAGVLGEDMLRGGRSGQAQQHLRNVRCARWATPVRPTLFELMQLGSKNAKQHAPACQPRAGRRRQAGQAAGTV